MKPTLRFIPPKLEAKETDNETDLYIYGTIGGGIWTRGINSNDVQKTLANIKTPIINVHIQSNGGDAFEGVAIGNLLKSHSAAIHVIIDGIAASAASVIAMAGNTITMPKNAMLMIHRASTIAYGHQEDLIEAANILGKVDQAVYASYEDRFKGEASELASLLEKDGTFLTAQEALDYGFCDEITAPVKKDNAKVNPSENDGVDDSSVDDNNVERFLAHLSARGLKISAQANFGRILNANDSVIEEGAPAPQFTVGERVGLTIPPHIQGHSEGTVREAVLTYAYGIVFDGMEDMGIHHWYVESELKAASSEQGEEDNSAANKNNAQQNPNSDNVPNMSFANKFAQALVLANQKLNRKE